MENLPPYPAGLMGGTVYSVNAGPRFGPHSIQVTIVVQDSALVFDLDVETSCGNCHSDIDSEISFVNGLLVWIIFGSLFAAGFLLIIPWSHLLSLHHIFYLKAIQGLYAFFPSVSLDARTCIITAHLVTLFSLSSSVFRKCHPQSFSDGFVVQKLCARFFAPM